MQQRATGVSALGNGQVMERQMVTVKEVAERRDRPRRTDRDHIAIQANRG